MALRPFLASLFFARPFCVWLVLGHFAPAGATGALPLDLCPNGASPFGSSGRGLRPTWATPSPLKRAALNFTPFVTQSLSWVLPGVLTAFCPKRKIASRNLARGVTAFRLLQHPTPGTTQVPAQPLGAERRGGSEGELVAY